MESSNQNEGKAEKDSHQEDLKPYKRYVINGREVIFTKTEFEALVDYFRALQAISMDSPAVIKPTGACNNDEIKAVNPLDSTRKVR